MLNIRKAITVSGILLNNFVSLSLFLVLFYWLGNAFAQVPPVPGFPPGMEFDPRHPRVLGEIRPENRDATAISENVEFVGATGGFVDNVFVQGNYVYLGTYSVFVILDAE